MQNINTQTTHVKKSFSQSTNGSVITHKQVNSTKRMWVKAATEEFNLSLRDANVLETIAFLTDTSGVGRPSIGSIQEAMRGSMSWKTTQRAIQHLASLKIITVVQNGKQKPNTYTLNGFQTKLEACSPKLSYDLIQRDIVLNTYEHKREVKSFGLINSFEEYEKMDYKKAKPMKTKAKPQVNDEAMNSDDKATQEQEIKRACKEHGLTEADAIMATRHMMTTPGIINKAAYLSHMIQKIRLVDWKIKTNPKPKSETVFGLDRKTIEQNARPGETWEQAAQRLKNKTKPD